MSDWRSIETCPQDGTWFLALMDDTDMPVVIRPIGPNIDIYEGFHVDYLSGLPTHWMPLPEPPATGAPQVEANETGK